MSIEQAFKELTTVNEALNAISDIETTTKVSQVLSACEIRMNSAFNYILTPQEYTSIAANLTALAETLQLQDIPSPQRQEQINPLLKAIILIINKIPFFGENETKQSTQAALDLLKVAHTTFNENTVQKLDAFVSQMDELEQQAENTKQKLAQLETKQAATEKGLDTSVLNKMTEFDKKYDELSTKRQQGHDTLHTNYDTTLKELNTTHDASLSELNNTHNGKLNTLYQQHEVLCGEKIELMNEKLEEIKKLYNLAGTVTTVGSQKLYADQANSSATMTFWLAVILMIFTALLVGWPLLAYVTSLSIAGEAVKAFDWKVMFYRTPVALLFLVPAFYLANVSSKLRDKGMHYRDLEIKLAAIHPYLENVTDAEKLPAKDVLRLELAKLLLSPEEKTKENKNTYTISSLTKLMEKLINKLP